MNFIDGGAAELGFVIPLTKIDLERRLVYGIAAVEEPDKSKEIFDYTTSKPFMQKWSEGIHTASGGLSKGNLRAMHQKQAIGRFDSIDFDDDRKMVKVCAHVVDDAEWKKVEAGVYTGFSVGGGYAKSWKDPATGLKRYTADVREISLVDNPCMPSARIAELVKGDFPVGQLELRGHDVPTFGEAWAARPEKPATFGEAWSTRPLTFGEMHMAKLAGIDAMAESPTAGALAGGALGGAAGAGLSGGHGGAALAGAAIGAVSGYVGRKIANATNRWGNKKSSFLVGLNAYNQRADRRKAAAAALGKAYDETKHTRNRGKFASKGGAIAPSKTRGRLGAMARGAAWGGGLYAAGSVGYRAAAIEGLHRAGAGPVADHISLHPSYRHVGMAAGIGALIALARHKSEDGAAPMKKAWSEEQHPRDHGQFTHGTSPEGAAAAGAATGVAGYALYAHGHDVLDAGGRAQDQIRFGAGEKGARNKIAYDLRQSSTDRRAVVNAGRSNRFGLVGKEGDRIAGMSMRSRVKAMIGAPHGPILPHEMPHGRMTLATGLLAGVGGAAFGLWNRKRDSKGSSAARQIGYLGGTALASEGGRMAAMHLKPSHPHAGMIGGALGGAAAIGSIIAMNHADEKRRPMTKAFDENKHKRNHGMFASTVSPGTAALAGAAAGVGLYGLAHRRDVSDAIRFGTGKTGGRNKVAHEMRTSARQVQPGQTRSLRNQFIDHATSVRDDAVEAYHGDARARNKAGGETSPAVRGMRRAVERASALVAGDHAAAGEIKDAMRERAGIHGAHLMDPVRPRPPMPYLADGPRAFFQGAVAREMHNRNAWGHSLTGRHLAGGLVSAGAGALVGLGARKLGDGSDVSRTIASPLLVGAGAAGVGAGAHAIARLVNASHAHAGMASLAGMALGGAGMVGALIHGQHANEAQFDAADAKAAAKKQASKKAA